MKGLPAADLKVLRKGGKSLCFSWGKGRLERKKQKHDRTKLFATPEPHFIY